MIKVYVKCDGNNPYEYINGTVENDVERAFDRTQIVDCEAVRNVIRDIEHGEYLNNKSFRDRFGQVLGLDKLSTGSKAAIALACNKGLVLDAVELGSNALDYIIHMDADAGIVVDSSSISFSPEFGEAVHALAFDPLEEKLVEVDTVTWLNEEILA